MRHADQHHVGVDRIAEQRLGNAGDVVTGEQRTGLVQGLQHPRLVEGERLLHDELGRRRDARIGKARSALPVDQRQLLGIGRHHHVGGEQHVEAGGRDARPLDGPVRGGKAQMRGHRAALLGKAGHVQRRGLLAVDMRGHRQHRRRGGDAGPADAGDQQVERRLQPRDLRLGQLGDEGGKVEPARLGPAERGALHLHEGGTEALGAGEVLVAGRLVDPPLLAEGCRQRLDGDAVGLHRTVAAALADPLVDEEAHVGIGKVAALAAAALFGRAGLVVDQHGDAGDLLQLLLHAHQLVAVEDIGIRRKVVAAEIGVRLLADDDDALDALRLELAGELRHGQDAVDRLAAGHRHRIVVEDLVGDRHLGGDGLADRQDAGVEIGAVAHIGEDVLVAGKVRLADPQHALAAHGDLAVGGAARDLRHRMAADAGHGAGALRHHGGGRVRAAGTEIGHPRGALGMALRPHHLPVHPLGDGAHLAGDEIGRQEGEQRRDDLGNGEFQQVGEEGIALRRHLAPDRRTGMVRPAIGDFLDLRLEEGALVLDDEQPLQPTGEIRQADGLQRPGHRHLVDGKADVAGALLGEADQLERLAQVAIGLAGGDDADARPAGAEGDPVEPVGPHIGARRRNADIAQQPLGLQPIAEQHHPVEIVVTARVAVLREDEIEPRRIDGDGRGGVHRVGKADQPAPQPAEARQGEAVQPVVQHFLDVGRVEHRHLDMLEEEFRLGRQDRGLGEVVVAGQRQHATIGRGAAGIGLAQHVAGPVDARRLAVPDTEDAVVIAALAVMGDLLAAPDGGGAEFLVDAGLEHDVGGGKMALRAHQLGVEAGKRRPAIAGDETAGLQPGRPVEPAAVEGEANKRLDAGQVDTAVIGDVFVVEGDRARDGVHGDGLLIRLRGSRARGREAPAPRAICWDPICSFFA